MTDPRAGPSRRLLLLLVLALAWMAAQAITLDLVALLGGFNVNDAVSGAHHAYALLNVGAWIVLGVGGVSFLFQTGRWRSALTAVGAGGVALVLQFYAIEAFQKLGADRFYGETTSVAIQAGGTAEASAVAAAISTALLALLVALVGFLTGERGASAGTEARRLGISVARSLRLRNFNVFSWLFGPVFQADVRVTGRRRSTYIGRAVYLVLLLGILAVAWFGLRSDIDNYSGAERLQQMQELAPGLATFLLWTQFLLLLFIAPQLTAPVICQERTGRTLPALLTTPLTSAQIVFGKLAGRLMMAIVLILLSVPLLLGVRVYGGLDSAFVVKAVAITISATVLAASLGVLASIWSKRATTAGVVAIILLALHSIGLPMLIAFVVFGVSNQPPGWVFTISPAITLGMLTAEAMGDPVGFSTQYLWIYNVGLNLAFAALTCLVATFAFRRVMVAEAHGQTIAPGRKKKRRRKAAASPAKAHDRAIDPASGDPESTRPLSSEEDETVERTSREVGSSPVLWREIRQSAFGGGSKLRAILMCVGAVGLILLLNLYFGPREEGLHYGVLAIGMILLCASAAVAATGTVAGEREAGAWTILLTTPLSGPEILLGKFLGACRRCWVLPAMILLDSLLAIAAGAFSAIFLLHLAIIIPATIVFLCGTGTLASLCFRKSATAGVANIGLAVGSWVGVPMLVAFVSAVVGWSADFEVAYTAMFSFNPVAMAEFALNGAADPSYLQYDGSYDLPSGMMSFVEFTLLLVVGMSLLAGAGLGALGLAAARFRFISERTS